jgi:hypothetical protein
MSAAPDPEPPVPSGDATGAAGDAGAWREQRARAVAAHGAALAARQAAEEAQARAQIAEFVAAARAKGLPTEPLRALPYDGGAPYRTRLRGWYIHPDRSVAIGEDGEYYVLGVAPSVRARISGVQLTPAQPRLIVGEGARDGASAPLATLLATVLAGGWS